VIEYNKVSGFQTKQKNRPKAIFLLSRLNYFLADTSEDFGAVGGEFGEDFAIKSKVVFL
jgi:hypothetical protein